MKQIHCYKCGEYLGDIRDAKLKKDMYHVCGKCVRAQQLTNRVKQSMGVWLQSVRGHVQMKRYSEPLACLLCCLIVPGMVLLMFF